MGTWQIFDPLFFMICLNIFLVDGYFCSFVRGYPKRDRARSCAAFFAKWLPISRKTWVMFPLWPIHRSWVSWWQTTKIWWTNINLHHHFLPFRILSIFKNLFPPPPPPIFPARMIFYHVTTFLLSFFLWLTREEIDKKKTKKTKEMSWLWMVLPKRTFQLT